MNSIFHVGVNLGYHFKSYKITQSMSGKGNCCDNAAAESFFITLKSELVNEIGQYKNRKEAKVDIFEYYRMLL